MNIALGAIILILLVLPGIVFRSTLINSDSLENPLDSNLIGELLWILIPSLFVHCIAFPIIEYKYEIYLAQIYLLIIGTDNISQNLNFDIISESWRLFLYYILLISFVCYVLAYDLKQLILIFRLDQKYKLANITNEWDLLLSGRVLGNDEEIDFVQLDLLVQAGNQTYLYCGILDQYFLSKNNGLDRLFLKNVYRRNIENLTPNLDKSEEVERIEENSKTKAQNILPAELPENQPENQKPSEQITFKGKEESVELEEKDEPAELEDKEKEESVELEDKEKEESVELEDKEKEESAELEEPSILDLKQSDDRYYGMPVKPSPNSDIV